MHSLLEEIVKKQVGKIREELESVVGRTFESCFMNALNVNWMRSLLEETLKKQVREALEHADVHSACPERECRVHGKSKEEINNTRNFQLHFKTKLSLPVYTEGKLEGENSDAIYVALIDANTGDIVSSGPESSIKLDVVVLEGDFNKDDNVDWTREEFENYVVKERDGRRPLLLGSCQVVLKEGVGVLGELKFTDNSSWNRSKNFRIGLKVASGYCENARIREAKTDAFPVKENRGKSCRKKHPPASDDEVWRLEKIAKDGKFHQRLNAAGIHKVEHFVLQLFHDSEKLRKILRMTEENWNTLTDHAKTCTPSGKLYVYYQDDTMSHGVVSKNTGQLNGVVENGDYFSSHCLSTTQKGYADSMMKKALDNWNRVEEFPDEASFASRHDKRSSSFPSGVIGGQTETLNPVDHMFSPQLCSNAVVGEAPLHFVQSTSDGTAVGHPRDIPSVNPSSSSQKLRTLSWNQMGLLVNENMQPSTSRQSSSLSSQAFHATYSDLFDNFELSFDEGLELLLSCQEDSPQDNLPKDTENGGQDHASLGKRKYKVWLIINVVSRWRLFIRSKAKARNC